MQIIQSKKRKQDFDGLLLSGLISGIVISSILILACIGLIIWSIWILLISTDLESSVIGLIVFFDLLSFVLIIKSSFTLELTIAFLKGKYDNKKSVALSHLILTDIAGIGIIIYLLILFGTDNKNNIQDVSSFQTEQIDLEYQAYFQDKEQNKIK